METMLDISKLIDVAQDIVVDEQLGFAAQIMKPVQVMKDEDGNTHELMIVLTMTKKSNGLSPCLNSPVVTILSQLRSIVNSRIAIFQKVF